MCNTAVGIEELKLKNRLDDPNSDSIKKLMVKFRIDEMKKHLILNADHLRAKFHFGVSTLIYLRAKGAKSSRKRCAETQQ